MTTLIEPGYRAAITRAVELLQENAKELLQSHTIGGDGDWTGEEEAKGAHDELIVVAGNLQALLEGPTTAANSTNEDTACGLRQALQFYADGNHFMPAYPAAWESVSGEPGNFLEDEAHTATVEDGSVAKLALQTAIQ